MPWLFFSNSSMLRRTLSDGSVPDAVLSRALLCVERAAVTDGVPFVLDDRGRYDTTLNRFFRTCPTMGLRSANSLKAYAFDIVTWQRFLIERRDGKELWRADRDDLAAFHASLRRSAVPYRIAASSWNRMVASLQKLYDWAVEDGLMAASPFGRELTMRRVRGGPRLAPMRIVRAREPAARSSDLRFLDMPHYVLFREVGLRGRRDDDTDDAAWRGRHGERNALFAELLVTTGLRLEEATSLLTLELPPTSRENSGAAQRSIAFRLPASVAKGRKSREIRLSHRWLRRLRDYIDLERPNAIDHRRAHDPRASNDGVVVILNHDRERLLIAQERGQPIWVRMDRLSPAERRYLVMDTDNGRPAALWLNESGRPMTPAAWEAVFRRAGVRCRALGIDIEVTPRALRHTFATHMLAMLIRAQIGSTSRGHVDEASGAAVYRRMIGDPLQKLQRLMGHASLTSTYQYLDTLEESRALVEAAAEQWMSAVEVPPEPRA
jgi:site-specific recombinase XerD